MKITSLIFTIVISTISYSSNGQCCTAGNPNSVSCSSNLNKKSLSLALNHRYSYSDQYYLGSRKIDYSYFKEVYFHFSTLNVSYGITDKLTTSLEIGYFESKSRVLNDIKAKAFGLGDAIMGLQYGISVSPKFNLIPALDLTLPIGKFDFVEGNVLYPIDFQPSAGSYRIGFGINGQVLHQKAKWNSSFFAKMSYSLPVISDLVQYYKYGNLYNLGVSLSRSLSDKINLSLTTIYELRSRAKSSKDFVIQSTGGQMLFLGLRPSIQLGKGWSTYVELNLPVFKSMNGRQLTNKYMLTIGLHKVMGLEKKLYKITDFEMEEVFVTTVKISGTCENCKNTIESLSLATEGVYEAHWNVNTMILTLKHSDKFNLKKLTKQLTKKGHLQMSDPETIPNTE